MDYLLQSCMHESDRYFDDWLLEEPYCWEEQARQLQRFQDMWMLRARCRWRQVVIRLLGQCNLVPDRDLAGV